LLKEGGAPAEYSAALAYTVAKGWLWKHESGTYVKLTPAGAELFAYTPRAPKGLSDEQIALMERESASLAREFKVAEQTYGADHLDLVLATGYVSKLLRNGRVVGYLAKHAQELLFEFQRITEPEVNAA
jgi:hypothetical protein